MGQAGTVSVSFVQTIERSLTGADYSSTPFERVGNVFERRSLLSVHFVSLQRAIFPLQSVLLDSPLPPAMSSWNSCAPSRIVSAPGPIRG